LLVVGLNVDGAKIKEMDGIALRMNIGIFVEGELLVIAAMGRL